MASEFQETLFGQVIAQNLLLRALWARQMAENQTPIQRNRKMISDMIDSMQNAKPPADEQEVRLWGYAKNALREFGEQIDVRLRGEGYQ